VLVAETESSGHSRYPHIAMADIQEQLQEIGAQLDWVRDYL
jgi:hypothetical protein